MALVLAILASMGGATDVAAWAPAVDGPWKALERNELLSKSCWVRTAEFGVCRVRTSKGELQLSPGTVAQWNGGLTVERGAARWILSGQVVAAKGAATQVDWDAGAEAAPEAGRLTVRDFGSEIPSRLGVARCHVAVEVRPPVALVKIEYGFYNPYDRQQEGEFSFRLPAGASISRFAMYTTPTTLVEGEVVDRSKASGVYESIVQQRRDPALLEQAGENQFRMRVFPLPPKEVKRIFLDYVVPVLPENGRCRLRLPLFGDLEPIGDFRIHGSIKGDVEAKDCTSAPTLEFHHAGNHVVEFNIERRDFRPPAEAFVSFPWNSVRSEVSGWHPPLKEQRPGEPQAYYATMLPEPVLLEDPSFETPPTDVLVLANTSGRVRSKALVRQAAATAMRHLRPADRVRLACIDVALRPMDAGWAAPRSPQAEAALAKFDHQVFLGRSFTAESLEAAAATLAADSSPRRRVVLYIGPDLADRDDGRTPAERTLQEASIRIAQALEKAKASFYAVRVDRPEEERTELLPSIVASTDGRGYIDSLGGPELEAYFLDVLAGFPPPLRVLAASAKAGAVVAPPNWKPGSKLAVVGSGKVGPNAVTLRLRRAGREFTRSWEFTVPSDEGDFLIGRWWAQCEARRLQELEASETAAFMLGDRKLSHSQKTNLIELGTRWGLTTPYTAYLVLESEDEYARYGIDRAVRRRYWARDAWTPPAAPPQEWTRRQPRFLRAKVDSRQLELSVAQAKAALAGRDPAGALSALSRFAGVPAAMENQEFADALDAATAQFARSDFLKDLGAGSALFDRSAARPLREFSVWPLLAGGAHRAFQELHPQAEALLRQVEPPNGAMSVRQLAEWIERKTGVQTILDLREIQPDAETLSLHGLRRLSLFSLLQHVRGQGDLRVREEPFGLVFSERSRKNEQRVLPVDDLLRNVAVTDLGLLADPLLDVERSAEASIREKLKQPISVDLPEAELTNVFDQLADLLGENIHVVSEAADHATVGRMRLRNVPAGEVLRLVCNQGNMTYGVVSEAIVVGERKAVGGNEPRVHSVRGLLTERVELEARASTEFFDPLGRPSAGFGGGLGGGLGGGGLGGGGGGLGGSGPGGGTPREPTGQPAGSAGVSAPSTPAGQTPGDPVQALAEQPKTVVRTDASMLVNTITETISRDEWEANGGDSTVRSWHSLDFVVNASEPVQREVEQLLERLRALPAAPPIGDERPLAPAAIRPPDHAPTWALINLISETLDRDTWEANGGDATLRYFPNAHAIVCSNERGVQERLLRLLTEMRRSRYAAERSDRPWEGLRLFGGGPSGLTDSTLGAVDSLRKLDKVVAIPEALNRGRREPADVVEKWSRAASGGASGGWSFARRGRRLVGDCGDFAFRMERTAAGTSTTSVVYPRLGLGERGDFADVALARCDALAPWFGHRTNAEIARRFKVSMVSQTDRETALRLDLPRSAATVGGPELRGRLVVAFSLPEKLPVRWEAYIGDDLQYQLKFSESASDAAGPFWKKIVALDAAGRLLETWTMIERVPSPTTLPGPAEPQAAFVLLNDESPALDAMKAIRRSDFFAAEGHVARAMERQPKQPFLHFLRAWCRSRSPRAANAAGAVEDLRAVAASPAVELTRFLLQQKVVSATARQRAEALALQPPAARNSADELLAASAAFEAGDLPTARRCVDAAVVKAKAEGERPPTGARLLDVELLLRGGDAEAARKRSIELIRALSDDRDLSACAALLLKLAGRAEAAATLDAASRNPDASPRLRLALLLRRIALSEGLERLRLLVAGREALPLWAPERIEAATALERAVEAEVGASAAELIAVADSVGDAGLRARLLFTVAQQRRKLDDFEGARNAAEKAIGAGRLKEQELTALALWLANERRDRSVASRRLAVAAWEQILRSGEAAARAEPAKREWLSELAATYSALGDEVSARRAGSEARN